MPITYKIPTGVKLKDLPLEQRILFRLLTVKGRSKTAQTADLKAIAIETGSTFFDAMKAVESLVAGGAVLNLCPLDVSSFQFEIAPEAKKTLQKHAANYNRHLKAKALRAERRKNTPPSPAVLSVIPAHLTPITAEQRAVWMTKANELAQLIERPHVAEKIANCIVRIGVEHVERLIREALTDKTSTLSARAKFFIAYRLLRDQLIPAK